ncbi:MAG: hypothetical protein QXU98_05535 [Candidatus Parvarchaeota archaeon]
MKEAKKTNDMMQAYEYLDKAEKILEKHNLHEQANYIKIILEDII